MLHYTHMNIFTSITVEKQKKMNLSQIHITTFLSMGISVKQILLLNFWQTPRIPLGKLPRTTGWEPPALKELIGSRLWPNILPDASSDASSDANIDSCMDSSLGLHNSEPNTLVSATAALSYIAEYKITDNLVNKN